MLSANFSAWLKFNWLFSTVLLSIVCIFVLLLKFLVSKTKGSPPLAGVTFIEETFGLTKSSAALAPVKSSLVATVVSSSSPNCLIATSGFMFNLPLLFKDVSVPIIPSSIFLNKIFPISALTLSWLARGNKSSFNAFAKSATLLLALPLPLLESCPASSWSSEAKFLICCSVGSFSRKSLFSSIKSFLTFADVFGLLIFSSLDAILLPILLALLTTLITGLESFLLVALKGIIFIASRVLSKAEITEVVGSRLS